jgi:hypothetical protein
MPVSNFSDAVTYAAHANRVVDAERRFRYERRSFRVQSPQSSANASRDSRRERSAPSRRYPATHHGCVVFICVAWLLLFSVAATEWAVAVQQCGGTR